MRKSAFEVSGLRLVIYFSKKSLKILCRIAKGLQIPVKHALLAAFTIFINADSKELNSMSTNFGLAEYIWLDGSVPTRFVRSKTRVVNLGAKPKITEFPEWSFDGSSTQQAAGNDSDCILQPVSYFKDPIRGEGNFLVMCEVNNPDGSPHELTHARNCAKYWTPAPVSRIPGQALSRNIRSSHKVIVRRLVGRHMAIRRHKGRITAALAPKRLLAVR